MQAAVVSDEVEQKASEERGRVLVVDDDLDSLQACRRLLETAGFEVEGFAEGHTAIARMPRGNFDAVVSDISMPGMTGIELLRNIRSRDLDIPVLLMTAYPALDTAMDAIVHGVIRYLPKPLDPSALTESVSKAVRINRLARLRREAVTLVSDELRQFGDRLGLEAAYERALESLWIAFQPLVSWSRHRAVAYEALLRTREPLLPNPGALLRAAERLGRLDELGRAVRTKVAAQMDQLPTADAFVNLHAQDLLDDNLFDPESPLCRVASRVVLEITERASLDHIPDCEARVRELRRRGFRLAVDDLGAGYAGLTSFTQIEPEVVKFDMSLVRDVDSSFLKRRLIRSMASLFKEMDITVVAEGVETQQECHSLVAAGCDVLQGYLFARPNSGFPEPVWF